MMTVRERSWPTDVAVFGVAAASAAAAAAAAARLPRQRDTRPSDVPRASFRAMMIIASDRNCYWRSLVAADARRLACC